MADLVSHNSEDLVVCHPVEKSGVDPDAAVGAGESVDVVRLVYLEIQWSTVDLGDALREVTNSFDIGVALGFSSVIT